MGWERIRASSDWSLDQLFFDQDGIPTLIEVKRAENTELRRKVGAQMLDYAANAVIYWPVDEMRGRFEQRLNDQGRDPDDEIVCRLGIEPNEIESFSQRVASQNRRI